MSKTLSCLDCRWFKESHRRESLGEVLAWGNCNWQEPDGLQYPAAWVFRDYTFCSSADGVGCPCLKVQDEPETEAGT
jgi:hypothetical protein